MNFIIFRYNMIKLGIVGSRDYTDYLSFKTHVECTLEKWNISIKDIDYIVSGGARGADHLAELFAKEHNIDTIIFKADWNTLGKKAGILRNTDIVNESTHMIAFPTTNSIGTWDSIRKSEKRKIQLQIIKI
jgi:cobalamin biosynthesis protein CbiG